MTRRYSQRMGRLSRARRRLSQGDRFGAYIGTRARCESGKLRYRTRVSAFDALAEAQASGSPKREEARAYECADCGGWHLTSWETP
jgi:hypothetical protein